MIDKDFKKYIDEALGEYKEYKKIEKGSNFTFQEFLLIIMIWKTEEILERLEEVKQ